MNKYKKIAGLMILCISTCFICGCKYTVQGDTTDDAFFGNCRRTNKPKR